MDRGSIAANPEIRTIHTDRSKHFERGVAPGKHGVSRKLKLVEPFCSRRAIVLPSRDSAFELFFFGVYQGYQCAPWPGSTLDSKRKLQQTLLYFEKRTAISVSSRHALEPDALRGSIDLLILKALELQAMHGWGIGLRIQQISKGKLEVNQGSLYPALQRLEHKGLIESDWQLTENNRRARYYSITSAGRRALGEEVEKWKRFAATIQVVLSS